MLINHCLHVAGLVVLFFLTVCLIDCLYSFSFAPRLSSFCLLPSSLSFFFLPLLSASFFPSCSFPLLSRMKLLFSFLSFQLSPPSLPPKCVHRRGGLEKLPSKTLKGLSAVLLPRV